MHLNISVGGKYLVSVEGRDGKIRYPLGEDYINNLIVDSGLSYLSSSPVKVYNNAWVGPWGDVMYSACVGIGTDIPQTSDSDLAGLVKTSSSYITASGACGTLYASGDPSAIHKRTYYFTTESSDINYTEAGWKTPDGTLWSHVLFPNPVEVMAGERLVISYQLIIQLGQTVYPSSIYFGQPAQYGAIESAHGDLSIPSVNYQPSPYTYTGYEGAQGAPSITSISYVASQFNGAPIDTPGQAPVWGSNGQLLSGDISALLNPTGVILESNTNTNTVGTTFAGGSYNPFRNPQLIVYNTPTYYSFSQMPGKPDSDKSLVSLITISPWGGPYTEWIGLKIPPAGSYAFYNPSYDTTGASLWYIDPGSVPPTPPKLLNVTINNSGSFPYFTISGGQLTIPVDPGTPVPTANAALYYKAYTTLKQ